MEKIINMKKYIVILFAFLMGCGTTDYVQIPVPQPVQYPQPNPPLQSNIYKIHCHKFYATYCGYTVYECNNNAVYNCLNNENALYLLN